MGKTAKRIVRFSSILVLMVMVMFGGFIAKLSHKSDDAKKKDSDENEKSSNDYLYSTFPVGTAQADAPPPGDGPGPWPGGDPCPGPDPGC